MSELIEINRRQWLHRRPRAGHLAGPWSFSGHHRTVRV